MGKRTMAHTSVTHNAILHTIPQAVDQVSADAATQIEATAKSVLDDAQVVADKLNKLALAIREHGRLATEHVAQYCGRTKHTMETVAQLQANLDGVADEARTIDSHAEETRLPEAPQLAEAEA